jgi:hypothetical protein
VRPAARRKDHRHFLGNRQCSRIKVVRDSRWSPAFALGCPVPRHLSRCGKGWPTPTHGQPRPNRSVNA